MNPLQHPALANAPKNALEAYERLLKAFTHDELQPLGNCQYSDSDSKPCAVGYFFTPEQRADIKSRGANDITIDYVQDSVGVENIESMTGMTMDQCIEVQRQFDKFGSNDAYRFKHYLVHEITSLKAKLP